LSEPGEDEVCKEGGSSLPEGKGKAMRRHIKRAVWVVFLIACLSQVSRDEVSGENVTGAMPLPVEVKDQIARITMSLEAIPQQKSNLILAIPDTLVPGDYEDLRVSMVLRRGEYTPARMTVDKSGMLVRCSFDSIIDPEEFIRDTGRSEVTLYLSNTSTPMVLVGDFQIVRVEREKGYVRKGYDTSVSLPTGRKVPTLGQIETTYGAEFAKKLVWVEKTCYRIDEKKNTYEKCY
jgi:hypothetical protein